MDEKEVIGFLNTLVSTMHFSGEEHGHNIGMSPEYCSHQYCQQAKTVKAELKEVYNKCWMYDELCD